MRPARRPTHLLVALATLVVFFLSPIAARQALSSLDRGDDRAMLRDARDVIKKNYYDPKFHGLDIDQLFAKYDERIQAAQSNHQAFLAVAGFVENLNDSHTRFFPPGRVSRVNYGYTMQMIGDKCFVTRVRPGTDAAMKLRPGDQILKREGYEITRGDIETLLYIVEALAPRENSSLDLLDPSGQAKSVTVDAKVIDNSSVVSIEDLILEEARSDDTLRDRSAESENTMIWKIGEFGYDPPTVDHYFNMARKHDALILDLRGNPGGSTDVLEDIVGHLFDHDVKIADRVSRKETKAMIARGRKDAYSGKVFVLIDSRSASAAELLARVVQLENRGTVVGDRSMGAVMEARFYPFHQGQQVMKLYDFEVTDADLIMKDGQSLEKNGVTPNDISLPSAADLAAGLDPVLSHTVSLAGGKLDPVSAGKLFPTEWPHL